MRETTRAKHTAEQHDHIDPSSTSKWEPVTNGPAVHTLHAAHPGQAAFFATTPPTKFGEENGPTRNDIYFSSQPLRVTLFGA